MVVKHALIRYLADLSNAVQVPKNNSIRLDIVGIHHWQAPEIRRLVFT